MSTTVTTPSTPGFAFAPSEAQERPKMFITGRIMGIGDPATTQNGDGDYEMVKLVMEPTNGSRKLFPSLLFRSEQFSKGFRPTMYKDYERFPSLSDVRDGKKMTIGETFVFVYGRNIAPPSGGQQVTNLMAVCGGTLEGLKGFGNLIDQALSTVSDRKSGDFGLVELTPDEIVKLLRKYHESLGPIDLAAIARQGQRDGALTDNYELDSWVGPLTEKSHKYMVGRVEKSQGKEPGKKFILGYQV